MISRTYNLHKIVYQNWLVQFRPPIYFRAIVLVTLLKTTRLSGKTLMMSDEESKRDVAFFILQSSGPYGICQTGSAIVRSMRQKSCLDFHSRVKALNTFFFSSVLYCQAVEMFVGNRAVVVRLYLFHKILYHVQRFTT
jgi:hypothetical protein